MTEKRIHILKGLLTQIEESIPDYEKTNDLVSKSSVGWQLDHSLKVINRVTAVLIKTNPKKYKKEFNLNRAILFPLCYIPRGAEKAPTVVIPPDTIYKNDLISQLAEARYQTKKTEPLPKYITFHTSCSWDAIKTTNLTFFRNAYETSFKN